MAPHVHPPSSGHALATQRKGNNTGKRRGASSDAPQQRRVVLAAAFIAAQSASAEHQRARLACQRWTVLTASCRRHTPSFPPKHCTTREHTKHARRLKQTHSQGRRLRTTHSRRRHTGKHASGPRLAYPCTKGDKFEGAFTSVNATAVTELRATSGRVATMVAKPCTASTISSADDTCVAAHGPATTMKHHGDEGSRRVDSTR